MTATHPLPVLSSLGHEFDPGIVGFLNESNDILGDPAGLNARLEEDGYLYIRDFFDPELIRAGRRAVFEPLRDEGEIDASRDFMEGFVAPERLDAFQSDVTPTFKDANGKVPNPDKKSAFRPELAAASPEIRRVVFGPEICDFYAELFGEPIRHFDFIWARLMGPGPGTPTHCDWVYMGRGSRRLLTCWIPYMDVPLEVGGLMVMEKSHQKRARIEDYLKRDVDTYCENNPAQVRRVAEEGGWSFPGWLSMRPDSLAKKFDARWLTSEHWRTGDFITFRMDMIHGSLDNHSDRVRFSTDTRYQPASEPIDDRWIGVKPPGHSLAGKRGRIC